VARACTTLILQVLLAASIAGDRRAIAREQSAQSFPTSAIWTIEVSALPLAPPVASRTQLFVALQSGVSARRLDTGAEVWQTAVDVVGPMAASDDRLVVPVKGELRAFDTSTGAVAWTDRLGPLTAPPLVHGEFLLVASAEQVICYRVADGVRIWSREIGTVEQRPAVDGTRVYVPAADGRVIALDLATGQPAWEREVGINPTEPLAYGDRVFVGAAAKRFCSLKSQSGEVDWCFRVGAAVVGRPVADDAHVYYVAFDNLLRAHDRKNGAFRWKKDLRYRPSSGPLLVGASVAAPGRVPRVQVFDARSGSPTIQLTLASSLATLPLLIEPTGDMPARIAAVTGGLPKVWTVTLAGPAPAGAPPISTTPLTEMPGQAIPIGWPPVPPGRLPPDA
jgi:outer membrane protein assembly factor BamB